MVYFRCEVVPLYLMKAYRSRSLTPLILNEIEMHGQCHASAAMLPGKETSAPVVAGRTSDSIWTFLENKRTACPFRDSNQDHPAHILSSSPNTLFRLPYFLRVVIIRLFSLHASAVVHFSC